MKLSNRGSTALAAGIAVVAVVAAIVAGNVGSKATKLVSGSDPQTLALKPAAQGVPIPELGQASDWNNTPPLTSEKLKGKVLLIDFWDASCINCRRTFPFLRTLADTYKAAGLVVIGVHSPEFDFEKSNTYVKRTGAELGVTWPVANDPDMVIWNAFGNQYWPAQYLVDRAGKFRAGHVGEGGDVAIENAVRTLLDEGGSAGTRRTSDAAATAQPSPDQNAAITPELYLGSARQSQNPNVLRYSGHFDVAPEYRTFSAGAKVTLALTAREVYAVLAGAGTLTATLDGLPIPVSRRGPDVSEGPGGSTIVKVDKQDLFHILTGPAVRRGTLVLTGGAGVQVFTFTFGS